MAIFYKFESTHLCESCYGKEIDRLRSTNANPPAGRIVHVCYGKSPSLTVLEVWRTNSEFAEYSKLRKPVTCEHGTGMPEVAFPRPQVVKVYNCVISEEIFSDGFTYREEA
ncbi:hypothetical protein [Streptomyces sp. YGL11-2]|uniref:hypothetical protein n=1 Tax=Streptomyces sp. YGL11-2 TaxID=3414028 RepID=UPI003CE76949